MDRRIPERQAGACLPTERRIKDHPSKHSPPGSTVIITRRYLRPFLIFKYLGRETFDNINQITSSSIDHVTNRYLPNSSTFPETNMVGRARFVNNRIRKLRDVGTLKSLSIRTRARFERVRPSRELATKQHERTERFAVRVSKVTRPSFHFGRISIARSGPFFRRWRIKKRVCARAPRIVVAAFPTHRGSVGFIVV